MLEDEMSGLNRTVDSYIQVKDENSSTSRSNTCIKRQNQARRNFKIIPVPFFDLTKELEQIENEPLPKVELGELIESDEENEGAEEDLLNKSIILSNEEEILENSFVKGFSTLPLSTPLKEKVSCTKNNDDFIIPKVWNSQRCSEIRKSNCMETPTIRNLPINDDKITRRIFTTPVLKKPINDEVKAGTVLLERSHSNLSADDSTYESFKKIRVNNQEFIILNELGRGGSSIVYGCFDPINKVNRAIKCVSLDNPTSVKGYINEVKVLYKLQYCNRIVKLCDYELLPTYKKLFVVLEVGGSDLSKILKDMNDNATPTPTYLILYYWMEMLYAVQQIHSNGIIHSDLKPANFLQIDDKLKLIDFGIASCLQNDSTSVFKTVSEGSFNYISPEALNNEFSTNVNSPNYGKPKYKLSYKSDVWSLGCILYQLLYKKTPFSHVTNVMQKLYAIANPSSSIEYPEVEGILSKLVNTVKRCLTFDVKSRPSVDDLILEYETLFS